MIGRPLLFFVVGYGLGGALEDWPGPLTAAAVGVVLAVGAFVVLYREMRRRSVPLFICPACWSESNKPGVCAQDPRRGGSHTVCERVPSRSYQQALARKLS